MNRIVYAVIATALAAASLATALAPSPALAARRPPTLTVWATERDWSPAVPISQLAQLSSYFDVVQPGASAPGSWDTLYQLQLASQRPNRTTDVAIWASTHNRTPPGRVVARPVFGGTEWEVWAQGRSVTFTLQYNELSAVVLPVRRWTYGTVHLAEMLRWLTGHGYLTGREQLTELCFGWQFSPAASGQVYTARRFTLVMRRAQP
jgi:hypothetical protein